MSSFPSIAVHQGLLAGPDPLRAEPLGVLVVGAARAPAARRRRPRQAREVPRRRRLPGGRAPKRTQNTLPFTCGKADRSNTLCQDHKVFVTVFPGGPPEGYPSEWAVKLRPQIDKKVAADSNG